MPTFLENPTGLKTEKAKHWDNFAAGYENEVYSLTSFPEKVERIIQELRNQIKVLIVGCGSAINLQKTILENFPENMGVEIKRTMKLIEPKLKNKTALKKNDDNAFKADSYMKTAENNLKLSNFNKAYLYFSKVIELVPGTDLAKKAEIEKNKIKDKVDKSVILNKTDKK